eukprot:scaffold2140_cov394-Prasinococcus_capsulatus_cf.AAC.2
MCADKQAIHSDPRIPPRILPSTPPDGVGSEGWRRGLGALATGGGDPQSPPTRRTAAATIMPASAPACAAMDGVEMMRRPPCRCASGCYTRDTTCPPDRRKREMSAAAPPS